MGFKQIKCSANRLDQNYDTKTITRSHRDRWTGANRARPTGELCNQALNGELAAAGGGGGGLGLFENTTHDTVFTLTRSIPHRTKHE